MSIHATISNLLEQGKISEKQAAALFRQLELSRGLAEFQEERRVKLIGVRVKDLVNNKITVEEKVPIALLKLGLKVGRKVWAGALDKYPEFKDFKVNYIKVYSRIEKDRPGQVLDLLSKDGSRRLEVWLE